jgi:NAD(P)-dependent dehydrogenase (short-subunit alcohol dehydrogenase family)
MNRFQDQVVMITGAAKGQGRNHALAFAREGARIAICDIARQLPVASPMGTAEQLDETVRMVEALGRPCLAFEADTRNSADMGKFVDSTLGEYGRVDVFIANAGIAAFGPFIEMPDDMWHDVVSINLSGVATSIRSVIPTMVEQRAGRIIATSSAVGREGGPNNANYAASKWGVIGFVKSIAIELAPQGVTVNAVAPMSV